MGLGKISLSSNLRQAVGDMKEGLRGRPQGQGHGQQRSGGGIGQAGSTGDRAQPPNLALPRRVSGSEPRVQPLEEAQGATNRMWPLGAGTVQGEADLIPPPRGSLIKTMTYERSGLKSQPHTKDTGPVSGFALCP